MDQQPDEPRAEIDTPAAGARRWRAVVGAIVGVGLVVGALVAIALRRDDLTGALDALSRAPWWMVGLALALPLANWVLVSMALWIITARHGPVRPGEMLGLVGGAWLLNYLPMRPGMFGRIAYHRKVNHIPVKVSMALLVLSMSLTAAAIAILVLLGLTLRLARTPATEGVIIVGGGVLLAASAWGLRAFGGPWRIATALLLRYLDMLVWVGRYWIVFGLVGQTLTFEQACAIAAVSQAATAIPLAGNGLGLREWAVGLTAGVLPTWFGGLAGGGGGPDPSDATTLALAADLINRGVELAVAVPVGLVGLAWVARRLRALGSATSPAVAGDPSADLSKPE